MILSCGVLDATFNLSVTKFEVMKNQIGDTEQGKIIMKRKFNKELPSYKI